MKITVLGCYEARVYEPSERAAIIRIGDTIEEVSTELSGNFEKEYRFGFHDLTRISANTPSNWKIFSMSDGKLMLEAFEEIALFKVDEVVVHCHAGISRSPAIAIALGIYLGESGIIQEVFKKPIIPNERVLDVMFATMKKSGFERRSYRNEIQECIQKDKEKMSNQKIVF
ncbi:hypothetical protein ABD91_20665 [Lysinibacillus sphaericus]|uniref:dual specificity protein phosphatase family protein n=1 Tax=Lysinibacillus sphaericus TaxID=1421 RepID=UPI0018CED3F1|nr:dual specificity protein phosphatase family protein [Lysinibacillus sphaericus]MBG9693156.1 hypothetical protein [Lysinibacillus sphaericus]